MDELDAIAARIHERDRGGARGPWTLEIYPTLACNLDCGFCDTTDRHRPPVDELSAARMLGIVDEAAEIGVRRVCILGGGEPLLAAHTPVVMRAVKARGMEGFLTTNGTLCGEPIRRMMVEIGWDEVHFSVDGADAPTHDALRGRAGAFRRTVTAICRLRAMRGDRPRIALHTVVTRENVDQLGAIVRLAAAVGATRVEFDHLIAYRAEQRAHALLPPDLVRLPDLVDAAMQIAGELGITTTLSALRSGERGSQSPPGGNGAGYRAAPCLKAWHYLVVQADGRTSPCCVLAGEGESVAADALATVWEESPTLHRIRAGMLAGRPTGRCAECSENILVHERNIRARLPAA